MIREARNSDIEGMAVLCKRFFENTTYPEYMDYSEEATVATLDMLVNSDMGIAVVLEDSEEEVRGVALALVFPASLSKDLTAQELCWWCEVKGEGLGLLTLMEEIAEGKGAKSFMMLSLEHIAPERMDKIYKAKGYALSEHTYIRRL